MTAARLPVTPSDTLSRLLAEFPPVPSLEYRPGDLNFGLMATVCNLIVLVGQHPELDLMVTEPIRSWVQQNGARPIFYRQVQLLGRAATGDDHRREVLLEGARILGIDPNDVLTDKPREPEVPRSLCLA